MASQLKKTVKPSGGDYTSLEACMDANEQDLVTADKYFDVEIDGIWESEDTTEVTIDGYTTDATRYINIYTTATARHSGKIAEAGEYILLADGAVAITLNDNRVTINGLVIKTNHRGINIQDYREYWTIKNNIIQGYASFTTTTAIGIYHDQVRGCLCANNIIYDFVYIYSRGILLENCFTYAATIINNTVYNCYGTTSGGSFRVTYGTSYNNLIQAGGNKTGSAEGVGSSDSRNNCFHDTKYAYSMMAAGVQADSGTTTDTSSGKLVDSAQNFLTTVKVGMIVKNVTDTTYSYVTSVDSDSQLTLNNDIMADEEEYIIYYQFFREATFENAGADDFHLGVADTAAKDEGWDGSDYITDDIDGDTRSGTWDIGADEYAAAGATVATPSRVNISVTVNAPTTFIIQHSSVTPTTVVISATLSAPTTAAFTGTTATPATASISAVINAPVVLTTKSCAITPAVATISIVVNAPTTAAFTGTIAEPGVVTITITLNSPTTNTANSSLIEPTVSRIFVASYSPDVKVTKSSLIAPGVRLITITLPIPTVSTSEAVVTSSGIKDTILRNSRIEKTITGSSRIEKIILDDSSIEKTILLESPLH